MAKMTLLSIYGAAPIASCVIFDPIGDVLSNNKRYGSFILVYDNYSFSLNVYSPRFLIFRQKGGISYCSRECDDFLIYISYFLMYLRI